MKGWKSWYFGFVVLGIALIFIYGRDVLYKLTDNGEPVIITEFEQCHMNDLIKQGDRIYSVNGLDPYIVITNLTEIKRLSVTFERSEVQDFYLYYDEGNGFDERKKISGTIVDGKLEFYLDRYNVKQVRLDINANKEDMGNEIVFSDITINPTCEILVKQILKLVFWMGIMIVLFQGLIVWLKCNNWIKIFGYIALLVDLCYFGNIMISSVYRDGRLKFTFLNIILIVSITIILEAISKNVKQS